jgi:hypothetical protein
MARGTGTDLPRSLLTVVDEYMVICVCANAPLRDEDFDAYLEARWVPDARSILIVLPPGCAGPDAAQRRRAAADWRGHVGHRPLTVVISPAVHRCIITALSWLQCNDAYRGAFYCSQFDAALAFAGVEPWVRAHVRRTAADLACRLGVDPASIGLEHDAVRTPSLERKIAS